MHLFLIVANALVISLLVIPAMLRLAPRLRMVDTPNLSRKVHTRPMARVGGWGIVVGALLPIIAWCPATPLVQAFVAGSLVLLVAGAIDDALNIGHWHKLAAQIVAVLPVVFHADLYVSVLPFFDTPLPEWAARAFTVFALVGVINALNHSDGLDGLAGGVALLSVLAMALLAWQALAAPEAATGDARRVAQILLIMCAAVVGGVLGFLRFNAHPARVFMGDTGSQFLGFTVGVAVVLLTQVVDPGLSPAVPALLLGLPVIDILAVVFLRYRSGMHLLMGSRNHIHHRLLGRGFSHYESVVVIYLLQSILVSCGLLLCRSADLLVLAVYVTVICALFSALAYAERTEFVLRGRGEPAALDSMMRGHGREGLLSVLPTTAIAVAVSAYLVVAALQADTVPIDFGVAAWLLAGALVFGELYRDTGNRLITRMVVYVAAVFSVYLMFAETSGMTPNARLAEIAYFALVAVAIGLALRYERTTNFVPTPTDYLVAVIVLGVGVLSIGQTGAESIGMLVVRCVVILYACELLMVRDGARRTALLVASAVMLVIVGLRAVTGT